MDLDKIIKAEADENGNIPAARISAIITAIKQAVGQEFVERGRFNEKLTDIDTLKSELAKAEEKAAAADQLQVKFDAVRAEFREYKAEAKRKEEHETKTGKFREILTVAGVPEKYHRSICECSGRVIDGIEFDENGAVKDVEGLTNKARTDWGDFIPVVTVTGVPKQPTALGNTAGRKYTSKDEIMSIKDPVERQAQIRENIDLFTNKDNKE